MTEKCYHQSTIQYDEFEDESTGEIIDGDFEVCTECGTILMNGEYVCDKDGKTLQLDCIKGDKK